MNLRVKSVLSIGLLCLLCLMLPGSIWADTVNINSINANSSPFSVDITTTNLLAQYGITLANVTPGTTVFVACGECGGNSIVSSSPPNVLIQLGNDNGMSYTLQFSTPLSTLSFTLAGNSKSGGSGTLVAGWSATALDASGNVVSSVGDPSLFGTFSPFPPQPFTLAGPGIASVTFFTQCFNVCGTGLNIADLSAPEIKLVSSLSLSLLSGDGQADPALTLLPKPLDVKVTDQNGSAVPGVPISFAITQQPSGANGTSLDSSTVTTAADGTASVQLTLGDTSGQYQVTASCTGCIPTMRIFTETVGKKTIFLIHGIRQDSSAMAGLAKNLQDPIGVDQSRYQIDAGYDFGNCATTASCNQSCTIGDPPPGSTPNTSNVTNGARKLAQYINDKAPVGDIILIGFSMGGLIARDMIVHNYYNVLSSTRHVAGLVTLGTPNLGYPFLQTPDTALLCGPLVQEMAGDFRSRAADGRVDFFDASGNQIAAVSPYLKALDDNWKSTPNRPGKWAAIAGSFCNEPKRVGSRKPKIGCSEADRDNDGVVCVQSAAYTDSSGTLLSSEQQFVLPDHGSAHTDTFLGTELVFGCSVSLQDSLSNPPLGGVVFGDIRDFIRALP